MFEEGSPLTQDELANAQNDPTVALKAFSVGLQRGLKICFPACVYKYDRTTHKATVMPLIKQGFFYDGWGYLRREPFEVSVRAIQCGGVTIDIPLYVGDTGWVFSSDRDTSLIKATGALTNSVLEDDRPINIVEDDYQRLPNTHQVHILSHGFFIPDNWGEWEVLRYKDNDSLNVANCLYLGSSMDTEDMPPSIEDKPFQKGKKYEQKTTCSIAIQPSGGVHVSSSSDKETNQNVHLSVEKNNVEMVAQDKANNIQSSVKVSAESGFSINQEAPDKQHHVQVEMNTERMLIRYLNNGSALNITIKDGTLEMTTTGDLSVTALGDVKARACGSAMVAAENVHVVAEQEATVSAKKVNASAAQEVNINAGLNVNIGSCLEANISGKKVNIGAGTEIDMSAADKIDIVTDKQIDITTKGEESTINVVAEGAGSKIEMKAPGEDSYVGIEGKVVSLKGEDINISGTVTVSGNIEVKNDAEVYGTMKAGTVIAESATVDDAPLVKGTLMDTNVWEY